MRLSDFKLTAKDFGTFGRGLQNPECVWVDKDGIWASELRGGVARVTADADGELLGSGIGQPNGFSRRPDGSFVVAGIGDGKLYRIAPTGETRVLLDSFDGKPLGAVNYACADGPDRIWMSVMTRYPQWHDALTTEQGDGYILRIEDNGARSEIVADGLDLTNEVKVSPDGQFLYAAETMGCRVVRFPIRRDGSLGQKESVGPESLGQDALPDGITLDAMGNVWVTIINQNGLSVIDKHGDVHVVFRDVNAEAVKTLAAHTARRASTVDQLVACASQNGPIPLPTSVAFSPDGRTAYVGTLTLSHLATFQLPKDLS